MLLSLRAEVILRLGDSRLVANRLGRGGGEVRFPGVYRIPQGETLSDIVLRAGGFRNASPESAIFIRKSIAKLEVERAAIYSGDSE